MNLTKEQEMGVSNVRKLMLHLENEIAELRDILPDDHRIYVHVDAYGADFHIQRNVLCSSGQVPDF